MVDDNDTNRTVLENMLNAWGMKVTLANSGRQALDLLLQHPDNDLDIDMLAVVESLLDYEFASEEEKRLIAGHLWIYSNEVDGEATPLSRFQPGEQVLVESHAGKCLGVAYVNPHSLICARLVSDAVMILQEIAPVPEPSRA